MEYWGTVISYLLLLLLSYMVGMVESRCGPVDDGDDYDEVISMISGLLTIVTGSLGILGNLISIVVLCNK